MINVNYLNHFFEATTVGHYYICRTCDVGIYYYEYADTCRYYVLIDESDDGLRIFELTCNEVLIKNIIE